MLLFFRRLAHLLRRRRAERELADELQFHREMTRRRLEGAGLPPDAADRAARRAMGNMTLAQEEARAVWVAPLLEGLWQDLRHGATGLRRSPGLVAVCALSLGLGIGLNTILYRTASLVYGHEPTMRAPDRVVGVEPGNASQFSYPDYRELAGSGIFADVLGFRTTGMMLGTGEGAGHATVVAVTPNFFEMLGVGMAMGRSFPVIEGAPEREPRLAIVTHGFWQARLASAPDAVGRSLVLNGERFTVVGVLPEEYRAVLGWVAPSIYVPVSTLTVPTLAERGSPSLTVLGRLAPAGSTAQAQADVTAFGATLERIYPERNEGMGQPARVFAASALQFRGTPAGFFIAGGLVWAGAMAILLIACLNVMGLLMARAVVRRREIAIRVALGSGRARVVQAMLVESVLLVLAGMAIGLPAAAAAPLMPWPGMLGPIVAATPRLDLSIVPYSLALVALATLVCGLVPALRVTRHDVMAEVRQGGDGATTSSWLRHALVVGQMAMSLALVVLALLSVRSEIYAGAADPGFDVDRGIVARVDLDPTRYAGEARVRLSERLVDRIERLPGVSVAGVATLVPLGGDGLARSFHPAGRTDVPGARSSAYGVGPGYFRSLGIPVLRGREFARADAAEAPVVAIVNETFARTVFPGQEVIGRRVQPGGEPEAEIVGLVADSRIDTIAESPRAVVYYPFAQRPGRLVVHVRSSVPPGQMVSPVARAIEEEDGAAQVSVETLREATGMELAMRRAGTLVMTALGVLALLLAMIGLYGVMAYVAASRTVEVGIRMALGATAVRIRHEVLGKALALAAAGAVLGGAAVLSLAPVLQTLLVGVGSFDPVAFGSAAALLAVVGLAAGLVPAYRASRVDPLRALRHS